MGWKSGEQVISTWPPVRERAPAGQDARGDAPLRLEERLLVGLGVAPLAGDEVLHQRLLGAGGKAHPTEEEVDLEVANLLLAELCLHLRQIDPLQLEAALLEQVPVAGHGLDPKVPVDAERLPQDVAALGRRQR